MNSRDQRRPIGPDPRDLARAYLRGTMEGSRPLESGAGYRGESIDNPYDRYGLGGYGPFGLGAGPGGRGHYGGPDSLAAAHDPGREHTPFAAGLYAAGGGGFSRFPAAPPGSAIPRPNHAGRGPRGYRRSDARITEEVCEALTRHPELDASDVEVQVAQGEVTLAGEVGDRAARRLAEEVAGSVTGVFDVHNRLRTRERGR
ncbi:MAG TPA: BON domain-containing protein [Gemmatimonadales bacterium]|nr:BON domain-containing protein [Gemmatimonadales bacterium]